MSDDRTGRILAIVERLEAGQADLAAKQGDLAAKQGDLAAKQGDLAAKQGDLAAKQGDLAAKQGDLAAGQADLVAVQASMGAKLADLSAGQASMGADLTRLRVDMMAGMDRLQDSLTAIRDDISTNYGTAEAAQRANDNTRTELRALGEVVSSLVRQIRRLDSEVRILKGDDS